MTTTHRTPDRVSRKRRWQDSQRYNQWWIDRQKAKCVVDSNGCWLWPGHKSATGYGKTSYRNKTTFVHRGMYQAYHGVRLETKQYVCHRCDVRNCCNPEHLFLGDQFANMHDSVLKGRHAEQLVTHCPRGHEYDEVNTYRPPSGGRKCKLCSRIKQRLASGWPEHLAVTLRKVPAGYSWSDL
jgi:hypothetical protein